MYKEKKVVALIAAAGKGRRMGSSKPKQFLTLGDKTILEKSTEAFENNASVDDIYIISSPEYTEEIENLPYTKIKKVVEGGLTRQESVFRGLKEIQADINTAVVLIHDAARPYVSKSLLNKIIESSYEKKAVIPVIPVTDTIKITEDREIISTPDRDNLFSAQTPQGFDLELVVKAHKQAEEDKFNGTDDAQLVERMGVKVSIVRGEEQNIKITTPDDLPDRKRLVGLGFDVHAFSDNRDLILGGVMIPYKRGLLGHSDADVLTHAFMDAILGALNLGDIGTNFPDTDQKYKDIKSTLLLEKVGELMTKKGYTLENADLIIIAEKPKMKDHSANMKKHLAKALNVGSDTISIKATTTEGLGFTGREEGIAAQAIVQLTKI